jgi:hypothetical protein
MAAQGWQLDSEDHDSDAGPGPPASHRALSPGLSRPGAQAAARFLPLGGAGREGPGHGEELGEGLGPDREPESEREQARPR